jgi:hypothetical protein
MKFSKNLDLVIFSHDAFYDFIIYSLNLQGQFFTGVQASSSRSSGSKPITIKTTVVKGDASTLLFPVNDYGCRR